MMGHVETFNSAAVCRMADITYRQLDYWCRTGVFDAPDAYGSGDRRMFTRDQVRVVMAVATLRATGVALDRGLASRIAAVEGPWEGRSLIVRRDGPVLMSIDLAWIEQLADEAIANSKPCVIRYDGKIVDKGARGPDVARVPGSVEQIHRVHSLMWAGRD